MIAAGTRGRRVAVFGGGPAGLTAAHELAVRGFQVTVYERHPRLGGKVRAYAEPGAGTQGRAGLPLTCGGHFFLPGYGNVFEMLRRIPAPEGGDLTGRLTAGPPDRGTRLRLVSSGTDLKFVLPNALAIPRSATPQALAASVVSALRMAGQLTFKDVAILASKIATIFTSGNLRRQGQFERINFADGFLRSDALSGPAAQLVEFLSLAGTDGPQGASAHFWLGLVDGLYEWATCRRDGLPRIQNLTMFMNNPESIAWFDPWADFLASQGVTIRTDHRLVGLSVDNQRIDGATVKDRSGEIHQVDADWYVMAMPFDKLAPILDRRVLERDPGLAEIRHLQRSNMSGIHLYLREGADFPHEIAVNLDVPWRFGIVAVSHYWNKDMSKFGDGRVGDVLSVEMTGDTMDKLPGQVYGKPAKYLHPDQLLHETVTQLRTHFPDGQSLFSDDAIHSWAPHPTMQWTGTQWLVDEPMMGAGPDTVRHQRDQVTGFANLFLAGCHTHSSFIGDGMDGAVETGKKAAQGVLAASSSTALDVTVVPFKPPAEFQGLRWIDDVLYKLGLPNPFDVVAQSRRFRSGDLVDVTHDPTSESCMPDTSGGANDRSKGQRGRDRGIAAVVEADRGAQAADRSELA
ncbi:hypothetical protein BOO86_21545 [Mycobacterium sp. CBMA 234]|uniref:hydroxysqualene dehydroxylase n=1 Tax=Mycolicibacterium sp. CBMA 234 TaxID=1918495 RepID=UPI0012DDF0D5|nr:FAD-dependent oxidoreductase [Mycolicibacterium sp. CBMA 234]MUL67072.1 hypothetical protein [Mycolicibacterium sp. CBMA 234]